MDKSLTGMRRNPRNVRFSDLRKVCNRYFGAPSQSGSHLIYQTSWQGDPMVNIQPRGGMAKAYRVRQVLNAMYKLEETDA